MRPFLALPLVLAAPAFADDLKACAAIDDAAARLACYDRLADRPQPATETTAHAAAPEDAHPATSGQFGAEQLRDTRTTKAKEVSTMQAHIVGRFDGWQPKRRFTLDNGQVWVVTDERSVYVAEMQNPPVTLRKGLFGAYYLRVEGLNSSAKVRRLQ